LRLQLTGIQKLESLLDIFMTGLHIIGSAMVFILMMVIVGDVFGRVLFGRPFTGAPELAKISLVAMLFLGMAKTLRTGKHIRATVLLQRSGRGLTVALNILANSCGLFVLGLLCWSSWDLMIAAWKIGEYEGAGALRIPTYHLRSLIVLCGFLTAIQFTLNLINDLRDVIGILKGTK
jgi:TRAP-type C4-dicarboxylate transport system permease small subunit